MSRRSADGRDPIAYAGQEWVIPANPTIVTYDKFSREPAGVNRDRDGETTVAFDRESGTLIFNLHRNFVDKERHNQTLSYFRKQCGADAVKEIVIRLSPETFTENFHEFEANGFTRQIALERVDDGHFALVQRSPRHWK